MKKLLCMLGMSIVLFLLGCNDSSQKKNQSNASLEQSISSKESIDDEEKEQDKEQKSKQIDEDTGNHINNIQTEESVSGIDTATDIDTYDYINSLGKSLEERINVPEGYERVQAKEGSLTEYIRNYTMKEDKSPVLLYDGSEKENQDAHIAIFKLPIENEDLQQCADSIMRMLGEYHYSKGEFDKIKFTLGNNFVASFDKWRRGYSISLNGNNLRWSSSSKNDDSYESFKRFMRIVFAYSGTMNMEADSENISLKDIQVGDIFIHGGSPGHVVMVVDVCKNQNGKKAFLLAQGFMPAQEFHVVINPLHMENPWYYETEIEYPLNTGLYTFEEGSLMRYHTR